MFRRAFFFVVTHDVLPIEVRYFTVFRSRLFPVHVSLILSVIQRVYSEERPTCFFGYFLEKFCHSCVSQSRMGGNYAIIASLLLLHLCCQILGFLSKLTILWYL